MYQSHACLSTIQVQIGKCDSRQVSAVILVKKKTQHDLVSECIKEYVFLYLKIMKALLRFKTLQWVEVFFFLAKSCGHLTVEIHVRVLNYQEATCVKRTTYTVVKPVL